MDGLFRHMESLAAQKAQPAAVAVSPGQALVNFAAAGIAFEAPKVSRHRTIPFRSDIIGPRPMGFYQNSEQLRA